MFSATMYHSALEKFIEPHFEIYYMFKIGLALLALIALVGMTHSAYANMPPELANTPFGESQYNFHHTFPHHFHHWIEGLAGPSRWLHGGYMDVPWRHGGFFPQYHHWYHYHPGVINEGGCHEPSIYR